MILLVESLFPRKEDEKPQLLARVGAALSLEARAHLRLTQGLKNLLGCHPHLFRVDGPANQETVTLKPHAGGRFPEPQPWSAGRTPPGWPPAAPPSRTESHNL